MPQAVICAYARTPFGKHRGALSGYSATELGAMAVKELLERAGIDPASGVIDQVYMGHVLQTGSGQAPARQAAMNAGLPVTTPCTTVNKVCGSSLKAAMIAATEIRAGVSRMVIAGGMESMSNAPHFVRRARRGEEVSYAALESVLVHDGLKDAYTGEAMGNTGETIAGEHSISREQSDAFAIRSHALANKAWDEGWLDKESFPVGGLERDEGIRPDSSMDSLSGLRTVFSDGGQITAGNSSQVSDGASAVLVASEEAAEEHGLPVLARIIDYATSGVESHRVMSAPIPTVRNLLKRNGMSMDDIDILEHNEAFAAASCAIQMVLGVSEDRFNPHGGAVAIGHPLGATGTRCLMTLVNALERIGGHRGIVTICLGGGNAVAMLVERD
ncbi:MAG: acetyl-CoA C-acyltransferase [Candidatus Poseidoniales archaeon]|jgi:acetyl-CoA C-acetyltransferase|uniref:thiolase family protein n=1 Tax=Candidatus Thalassarchaeum betae TaxID=2599289 RepID=UPI000FFFDF18|nr:thiolase family protein [Candidatus Thalassoarchaea betae]RTZ95033.1 MAG: acetyl-CoA C-acyltransferase [Candidatus Poseidoniales archaeon]